MLDADPTTDVILVPLDGSELADRAVPIAIGLLRPRGGRLVLLAVGTDDRAEELRHHLDEVAATVRDVPVDTLLVPRWDAAPEIVAAAEARSATICMTSHGRGSMRWIALGSVAELVVASASRPVVLVGPRCLPAAASGSGPVVLAHDGGELTDSFIGAACDAARRLDTTILLVTVIHPLDVQDAELADSLFVDAERRIRERGCAVEHLIEQRHFPADVLADVAIHRQVPIIVMAPYNLGGFARIVVGSTTMNTLHKAPCPVIAVSRRSVD